MSLKNKFSQFTKQLVYVPRTARLIWDASRYWTVAWGILLIFQGVLPAFLVTLTAQLIDSLSAIIGAGLNWEQIRPTIILALLMSGIMILTQVLQSVLGWIRTAQSDLIKDHLSELIHYKSATVDIAFYEMPEYHDHLHRAQDDLQHRPLDLLESVGGLLQNSITLISMGVILIPYGLWLPIVLLVSTLPVFYIIVKFNRRLHDWWEETTPERRWAEYYDMILVNDTLAPEIRLFNLGSHFQNAYQIIRKKLRGDQLILTRDQYLAHLGAGIFAALVTGGVMVWMVYRALLGFFTLGDIALFYQAFNRGQSLLRSFLGSAGDIYENILFLGNLFEFLDLEPQVLDPLSPVTVPEKLQSEIDFKNVTFRYPGSERAVFDNFNFTIPAGKVVAIVGANGAGKTTLMKLLCRFYDPEDGRIAFDGIDIRNLRIADLRRMLTVMFQYPMLYMATAKENIAMGDITTKPTKEDIETAAIRAGSHDFITRLSEGYETLIGKWFSSGTELSGGEKQRLSLTRVYLRQAQIMVLDEPTSFMDSWSEIDWFDRLRTLANGRTAVIITHRFTIARHADVIHVMDKGQMVESGTHDELLVLNGRYAASWQQQIEEKPDTDQTTQNGSQNGTIAIGSPLDL